MDVLLVVVQRERTLEIFLAHLAEEAILVVVIFQMLVQQILPRERLLAVGAGEFIWIHVERVVPGQIVQSGVFFGADVAGEHGPLGVTSLVVPQVPFLREGPFARAASHLIRLVLFHVHVISQLVAVAKLLLAKFARVPLRLLVLLYVLQELWICHDFVKESVL